MRNYQPFNVDGLYNFYRYKMLAYKEWYKLFSEGKLNEVQSQFSETVKLQNRTIENLVNEVFQNLLIRLSEKLI